MRLHVWKSKEKVINLAIYCPNSMYFDEKYLYWVLNVWLNEPNDSDGVAILSVKNLISFSENVKKKRLKDQKNCKLNVTWLSCLKLTCVIELPLEHLALFKRRL